MSWIIEIKNVKATEEFLENVDDDFTSTIEGDGASAHLAMDIRNMIEKEKMYTVNIERKWVDKEEKER